MDYAYTIQGWLKGVNSNTLYWNRDIGKDADPGVNQYIAKDEFGFTLSYFNTASADDYEPIGGNDSFECSLRNSKLLNASSHMYNGNIGHMVTAIDRFKSSGRSVQGSAYQYDQINRLKSVDVFRDVNILANNWLSGTVGNYGYKSRYSYDANGNITYLKREGDSNSLNMDSLYYNYESGTNKLRWVDDYGTAIYDNDIDDQNANNYSYDLIGNLIGDNQEALKIYWNTYGKIRKINDIFDNTKIRFAYSPGGNRIVKDMFDTAQYYFRDAQGNIMAIYSRYITNGEELVRPEPDEIMKASFVELLYNNIDTATFFNNILRVSLKDSTNFEMIRDAFINNGGDFLSVTLLWLDNIGDEEALGMLIASLLRDEDIDLPGERVPADAYWHISEFDLYGSSRLGMINPDSCLKELSYQAIYNPLSRQYMDYNEMNITYNFDTNTYDTLSLVYERGKKFFELCNHLGNVMLSISDRKLPKDTLGDNSVDHFRADVLSAGDYYAGGSLMPGRNFNSSSYRFGYNAGSEKDDEITGVTGSHFTTFFREFDTRILKPWTPDPVFQPWQSPYSYMDGNPILFNDPLGNDIDPTASGYDDAKKKATPEYKKGKDGKVLYKKDGVTPKKQINNDYNEEFAKQFNNLKDNHSIMVKFEHIGNETDVGGTVSFDEINAVDQNVYSVKWNPNLTTELGASGIFEETFHLIDGLEGKNFKFIMGGGVDKFDLYDEARAKEWVVNNVKIKDNYSPETGYTNYTHYGYFKSQLKVNSKEGIVRLLHDGNKIFNQSTDIPSIGYNNVYYEKGYKFFFGGRYGKMSTEDLKVSDQ